MTELVDVAQFVRFKFIWHSQAGACKKCALLNARVYEQSIFEPYIIDQQFGPVWALNGDYSLAHGGTPINCRCMLEIQGPEIDEDKLAEYFEMRLGGSFR